MAQTRALSRWLKPGVTAPEEKGTWHLCEPVHKIHKKNQTTIQDTDFLGALITSGVLCMGILLIIFLWENYFK